jgi:hypothetical protein
MVHNVRHHVTPCFRYLFCFVGKRSRWFPGFSPRYISPRRRQGAEGISSFAASRRQFFKNRSRILRGSSFLQIFHRSAVAFALSLPRSLALSYSLSLSPSLPRDRRSFAPSVKSQPCLKPGQCQSNGNLVTSKRVFIS